MPGHKSIRQRGFTLLEVLIALAVLAIAMAALIKGISAHVNNVAYLKERTLAHWVALNEVAKLRASNQWPRAGELKGDAAMAGREFQWVITVSEIKDPEVRQLRVKVMPEGDEDRPLASLIALMGKPS